MEINKLNIDDAYYFYKKYILDYATDKVKIYQEYGFEIVGSVGFRDWEVFAAILFRDRAKPGDGADLMNHEVKSITQKSSSFEYQYHKNHGIEKLNSDKQVDHIFIVRSSSYKNVSVWWVDKKNLHNKFDEWMPELIENYKDGIKQRFRKSISLSLVQEYGVLVLKILDGSLITNI